jgi:hypothetical protein
LIPGAVVEVLYELEGTTPWMDVFRVQSFMSYLKPKEGVKGRSQGLIDIIAVEGGYRSWSAGQIVSIDGLENPQLILAGRPG